ncbi:MAG: hypothetical protein KIT16_16730 [Rhodospirillaceae bacterium]|nr:hypothetical protein [Rhodospirillaceae bacterium]
MSQFRPIEIDIEVHRAIEAARNSFAESPNDVLRRLLRLKPQEEIQARSGGVPTERADLGQGWRGKGVYLPNGTSVRMAYRGQQTLGEIRRGLWWIDRESFSSPSDAAAACALTKNGDHPSLNGWNYWEVKRPGDFDWTRLADLRRANKQN